MSESDSIVHQYLLTVSEKLAKQFSKKRPNPTPWSGPTLDLLIDFYKTNFKEEAATETPTNGTCEVIQPAVNGVAKKKGKKRKLSEVDNSVTEVTAVQTNGQTATEPEKKKKKKVKKSKKNKTPEVVEIIQVAEDKTATEETPAPETPAPETPEPQEEVVTPEPAVTEEKTVPGGMVTSVVQDEEEEEEEEERPVKKSKLKRKQSNSSFRRIKEEEIVIKKELTNNAFEAKGGADEFGHKANQILKFTKGKSFRHEKTKKKRGTYKGGAINMGVTSIKFDSD